MDNACKIWDAIEICAIKNKLKKSAY